jgi:hypothetical protein
MVGTLLISEYAWHFKECITVLLTPLFVLLIIFILTSSWPYSFLLFHRNTLHWLMFAIIQEWSQCMTGAVQSYIE